MIRLLLVTIILAINLFPAQRCKGQSPVFSQYYSTSLFLNPAMAGLEKDIYMGMNYRSQWASLGLPFNTFQFSFIKPLVRPGTKPKHYGGLGATFLNDVAGPNGEFKTQSLMISGAYNIHLNRYGNNILSVGLQAGALQQKINLSDLQWSSQYSPGMGFDGNLAGETGSLNNQLFNPLFNAGMMWFYTSRGRLSFQTISAFTGLSVSNIIRPKSFTGETNEPTLLLYKLHGGVASVWNKKFEVAPNYLIQYQNARLQVNVGTYLSYFVHPPHLHNSKSTKVMFGAWYRLQDAFILSAGCSNRSWNLGFSYDTNISSLGRNFGYANAYELSLAYKIVVNKGFKKFSTPLI